MNKKSRVLLSIFALLILTLSIEVSYLTLYKSMSDEALSKKMEFVAKTGLPDLALSSETPYIRHRTLSNVFSIYKDDATLREYSYSSFAISNYKKNYE